MKKKYIILIIIILVLVGTALFVDVTENQIDNLINKISGKAVKDMPENDSNNLENDEITSTQTSITSSESLSESSSSSSDISNNESAPSLPDIENSPCGYYFEGYEVCGGKCPEGECIQEVGSCYCRID